MTYCTETKCVLSTPIRRGLAPPLLSTLLLVTAPAAQSLEAYDPPINPGEFSTEITKNPYFAVPVGSKFVYQAKTDEGLERTEILVPGWTKMVMGVETLVYWDRVYLDGELVEDTRDYLAQHENGDVWYFGEDVDNYEDGILVDHAGSWIGGVDGALPGIWIKAAAKIGDRYRQEFYSGKAEDFAEVVAVSETVETPLGKFDNCMKTFDWSALAPDTENKYYCRSTGITTLEVELVGREASEGVRVELIGLDPTGAVGLSLPPEYAKQGVIAAD